MYTITRLIAFNVFSPGGSLADVITRNHRQGKSFSEPQLKQILLQVAQGLEYIHNQGLVHLDIKPGETNVFFFLFLLFWLINWALIAWFIFVF